MGGGLDVFVELCEEIVDRLADALEQLAQELRPLSEVAFHTDDASGRTAIRSNQLLRSQLRSVGRMGDRLSDIRDALAGLDDRVARPSRRSRPRAWPNAAPLQTRRGERGARHRLAERLRRPALQQDPVPARRHRGPDRHRPERHLQGLDDSFDRRHPPDPDRRHLWHELQGHAGVQLGYLWLSLWLNHDQPSAPRSRRSGSRSKAGSKSLSRWRRARPDEALAPRRHRSRLRLPAKGARA